jgi:hypothetical protein
MPIFGQYETVREVHRGGMGAVATARRAGGPEEFVVKELRVSAEILGDEQAGRSVAVFIERAKVQQKAAAAAQSHWAPVYEVGPSPGGAFYVTTLYPRSAQRLIHGRVKLDGQALLTIVESVLSGLKEIQDACDRPHGNLKPTNVLIAGGGEAPLAAVVLSDPTESGSVPPTQGPDLRAVGELIYSLVMHQGLRARGGWPVPISPEWSRLGRSGQAWLDLCNRLLDPATEETPPPIESVIDALPRPAAQQGSRRPLILGGIAAGVLVLGLGAWLLMKSGPVPSNQGQVVPHGEFNPQAWTDLCTAYFDWFGALNESISPDLHANDERRVRFGTDPGLAAVLAEPMGPNRRWLDPRTIAKAPSADYQSLGQDFSNVQGSEAAGRTKQALSVINNVRAALTGDHPERWPLRERALAMTQACQKRGWTHAADYLKLVTDRLTAGPDLRSAIEALLDEAPLVDGLETLNRSADAIAGADDSVLAQFVPMVAAATPEVPAEQRTPAAVSGIRQSVKSLAGVSRDLATFVNGDWKTSVDHDAFASGSTVHQSVKPGQIPTPEQFAQWNSEARQPKFRSLADPNPFKDAKHAADLAKARDNLKQLQDRFATEAGADIARFSDQLKQAEQDLTAGVNQTWNRLTQENVVKGEGEFGQRLARLNSDILSTISAQSQTVQDAATALAREDDIGPSAAINQAWRTQRDQIRTAAKTSTELRRRADSTRSFLRELESKVPAVPAFEPNRDWTAGLASAAKDQREKAISAVVAPIPWTADGPPSGYTPAATAVDLYTSWSDDAKALATDVGAVEDRLDAMYPTAQPPGAGKSTDQILTAWTGRAVFSAATVQAAIKPVLDRVQRVRQIAAMKAGDRAALVAAAADTGHPDAAFAAWRRLGDPDIPWPPVRASLDEEGQRQSKLGGVARAAAAALPAAERDARRQALIAELDDGARQRWERHAAATATADEFRAAAAMKDAFKVDPAKIAEARTRFNLRLIDLEATDPKSTDEQAKGRIASFQQDVRALPGLASDPAVSALLGELQPLTSEAPEPPKVDIAKIGPGDPRLGAAAWAGTPSTDGGSVTFTHQFTAQGAPFNLTFVRVAPDGAPEAFICTQETTADLFIKSMAAGDRWATVGPMLPQYEPQFPNLNGPRVWVWSSPARPGRPLNVDRDWFWANPDLKPKGKTDPYPTGAGFPPASPVADSPMNFVTPVASLYMARVVGCRLPTSAEWAAAVKAELSDQALDAYVAQVKPNLRDQTWEAQRAYIQGLIDTRQLFPVNAPPRRADAGAFAWTPPDATSYYNQLNDGAVWFVPTPTGPGRIFHNLIGNVAEWLLDDAAAQDAIAPGTPPPDQVRTAAGTGLKVAGASALSPRQVDPRTPVVAPANVPAASDVGFRLAFSAAGATLKPDPVAVRLTKVLATPRYLLAKP